MNRKEFLAKLGIGATFALTATCLGGCSKDDDFRPLDAVDFTLDLTDSANSKLLTNGGYLIKNKVVVARTTNGEYVAATQQCSHEGTYAVILKNDEWFCTDHDARFDLNGGGLNKDGKKGLTIYKAVLNGNLLSISS